jgi:hypothetical protein
MAINELKIVGDKTKVIPSEKDTRIVFLGWKKKKFSKSALSPNLYVEIPIITAGAVGLENEDYNDAKFIMHLLHDEQDRRIWEYVNEQFIEGNKITYISDEIYALSNMTDAWYRENSEKGKITKEKIKAWFQENLAEEVVSQILNKKGWNAESLSDEQTTYLSGVLELWEKRLTGYATATYSVADGIARVLNNAIQSINPGDKIGQILLAKTHRDMQVQTEDDMGL